VLAGWKVSDQPAAWLTGPGAQTAYAAVTVALLVLLVRRIVREGWVLPGAGSRPEREAGVYAVVARDARPATTVPASSPARRPSGSRSGSKMVSCMPVASSAAVRARSRPASSP
jgi:hypothetical protein